MSFAWARRVALGGCLLASACKGSDQASAFGATDSGGDASSPLAITFAFDPTFACASGGLCAPSSQVVTLGVSTTADTAVSIALEGDYADAALTAGQVTTSGGHGQVTLETSSTPTTFTIVARAGTDPASPTATLAVTVGASGFAMLRATPTYAGTRANPGFFAASITPSTCAVVTATPPTNPTWLPAPNGMPVLIPVPAGQSIAVDVRIGYYATGCADVAPLAASVTRDVSIDVYDVAMALALTDMSTTFTFTPDADATTAWQTAMTTAASNVGGAFFGSSSEGTALLDAMQAQVPSADQAQFDTTRTQGGWDATTTTWLTSHAPSMHDRAATWLTAAAGDGIGALLLHLGAGAGTGTATVTPTSIGPLAATLAGLTSPQPFSWTADADDTVHLAGPVNLSSSPYIAHLADTLAESAVPNTTSNVPGAIASQIDCQGLASSLAGMGDAYPACDASCVGDLCAAALTATWNGALASPASGSDALTLTLTVGAAAEVGNEAEPQYFQGGWLGQVAGPIVASSFSTKGTVVAEEVSGAP